MPASRARCRILALTIPIALFSIKFRYLGSGDTVPAELLPIRILEHGSLTFSPPAGAALPYWWHQTRFGVVSSYPIVPGLVNVPVYAAARALGADLMKERLFLSHVTAALCALVSVWFVYLVLERLLPSPAQALGFALIYALCTEVSSVASRSLFQHGPALMFLSAGLWSLLRRTTRADAMAGLLLCLVVLARPTNALVVLPLVVWAGFLEPRRLLALTAGAAAPGALHAAYAWRYWGSPFSLAQPWGIADFGGNPLQGIAGLLVSPARGLFVFSPVFLFGIPAAVRAWRTPRRTDPRAPLMRALTAGIVLTLALFSSWRMWWGGYSFGYRLIAELALPLTLLVAWDWPRIRDGRVARSLFAVAVALSLLVHALGAYQYPSAFDASAERDPIRLWDPFETELTLRARRVMGPLRDAADERLVPSLRRAPVPQPRWWSSETRDDAIPRSLDAPREGGIVRGPLRVSGWAKPSSSDVGEVLVSINPGGRRVAASRSTRPGLDGLAGFEVELPPPTRLEAATALVEVRDARGRVAKMGPVFLLWGPAR